MMFVRLPRWSIAGLMVAAVAFAAKPVEAQDPPEVHTEAVALGAVPEKDQTLFNLSIGVTGNSGNTRAVSGNGGFNFLLTRKPHVLTIDSLGTLGWANNEPSAGGGLEANARNYIGKLRYDYFLSERDALFAAFVPRRDLFAGIRARMQLQAGYARVLYAPKEGMGLTSEIGGDITIDRYQPLEQEGGMLSSPIDTEIYSVRLFLGYQNMINKAAQVKVGVEALLPPYDKRGEDGDYRYRINGNAELHSSLTSRFSMGGTFRVLYDSSPPVGTPSEVDTVTTFVLTYTYDSLAEKAAAEEEPACPPCEASEAEAAASAEGPETTGVPELPEPTPADAEPVTDAEPELPESPEAEAATEEAAAEATAPAEEAVEATAAEPPPAGTEEAPVAPPETGGE